ncbi:hypothetical protein [Salmonirosea aquatica]|uniref:hypothetical protein n=1 Tax=Salmonirosea aquatica TaxID=2654236 RepID=UPI0035713CEF
MQVVFWLSLLVVFYTYVGYGLVLFVLVRLRRLIKGRRTVPVLAEADYPSLALVVAAYNEVDCMEEKIRNTLALDYPAERLSLLFVTDGSFDGTPDVVRKYPRSNCCTRQNAAARSTPSTGPCGGLRRTWWCLPTPTRV